MGRIMTDELQLQTLENRIITIRINPRGPQQSLRTCRSGAALVQEATSLTTVRGEGVLKEIDGTIKADASDAYG